MLIYDIEIQNAIPPQNPAEREEGIIYCDGWKDHQNMGIAVIGCYDYAADAYRTFGENELEEFQKLIQSHDCLVGFNNINFDNLLLRANGIPINDNRCYDILCELYAANGTRESGFKLNDVCAANFGQQKTGDGALAPILWQRGQHCKVIDYCLNDVRLTKKLLDRIIRCGYLNSPKNPNQLLRMKRP